MKSFDRMIKALRRLPGVGPRQAERYTAYFLKAPGPVAEDFIAALRELKASVRVCRRCFSYAENELCEICSDPRRNQELLCVVEDPQDVEAVEKTGAFRGYYHVLGGPVSPIDGLGVDSVRLKELVSRVKAEPGLGEVIIATDPDTEGEATALYIADLLRGLVPRITRIAYGVPLGGDLDYTDELTLGYALKGRTDL
ncbi:MAG: recombination mediator RecR [Elusimicrobiaceae bacterium]|nr:recombination mediator RecR [Elusimicrobiaceae bacterium]